WMTATKGTDLGTLTIGSWTARPKTGTADIDPYSRATIVRNGELPIGAADGSFEIHVASRSRSGNWLPTGGIERYSLMLRLYDTPVGVATRSQREAPMPAITTVGCPT